MNYNEFKAFLKERFDHNSEYLLNDYDMLFYDEGYTSENESEQHVIRDTNSTYFKTDSDSLLGDFAFLFDRKSDGRFCRFYIPHLFERYNEDGWESVIKLIDENRKLCDNVRKNVLKENLSDYETARPLLIIRPINIDIAGSSLDDCLYKRIGDIALVLYIRLIGKTGGIRYTYGSNTVFRSEIRKWRKDLELVWYNALMNTMQIAPPRFYTDFDNADFENPDAGDFMAPDSPIRSVKPDDIPLITTTQRSDGAISIFYPGVMNRVGQIMNGDFYAAFTSTSEVRLHAIGSTTPETILSVVTRMNQRSLRSDILSGKVYLFDNRTKAFTPIL